MSETMSDEERDAAWRARRRAESNKLNEHLLRAISQASIEDRVMTVVEDPSTLGCIPWALAEITRLREYANALAKSEPLEGGLFGDVCRYCDGMRGLNPQHAPGCIWQRAAGEFNGGAR
jgi:hypothetical protein